MPIDFFQTPCKTESTKVQFGLCDDTPNTPACINESDKSKWIAIVNNANEKHVEFYAIDNCVEIIRPNGNYESRCDGVLKESTNLIFVELKCREGGQWFKKGRNQLTVSIGIFKGYYDMSQYTNIKAYVCNSQRPISHSGRASNIQQFLNETGYLLHDKNKIEI